MYQQAKLIFLVCETSLHAGSGDAHSFVDLPIQRENHTGYPKIESSSLKGAIREAVEQITERNNETVDRLFGPENNPDARGALGFTDARLLLFPVRSMKGTMAWITCPRVLRKLQQDAIRQNPPVSLTIEDLPSSFNEDKVFNSSDALTIDDKIMLEEFVFIQDTAEVKIEGNSIGKWIGDMLYPADDENNSNKYWNDALLNKLVIVSDDMFRDFVTHFTEIVTRNRIDNETGTVEEGALFTEEYLPPESVLYTLVTADPEFISDKKLEEKKRERKSSTDNMTEFHNNLPPVIQIGGNATLGKGIIHTINK